MINAMELMLHNVVKVDGEFIRITSFSEEGIELIDVVENGVIVDSVPSIKIEDVYPIPITPELLEKCGFIEKGHVNEDQDDVEWMQHPNLQDLRYRNGYVKLDYLELPHIQHLHQLQNLYLSITGEELQINL